jgi:hypothetical protein
MCECENAKALIVEGGKGTNRQRWMSMALVETIKSFEDHVKKSSRSFEDKLPEVGQGGERIKLRHFG